MNDETLQRAECFRQMLATYHRQPTPEQVAMYAEVVGEWPLAVLREGLRDAMREAGEFAPGPGTVRRCCAAVAKSRSGDPAGWQGDRRGLGAGGSLAQLMASAASRTPSLQAIFARAREIRAAGLVPPDLRGRFAAEVLAELELDPQAEVSAEMRRCLAHAERWRAEKGLDYVPKGVNAAYGP